jgi:hypothetical protein
VIGAGEVNLRDFCGEAGAPRPSRAHVYPRSVLALLLRIARLILRVPLRLLLLTPSVLCAMLFVPALRAL